MWDLLPFDLLFQIFSFLSPDSLSRATSICRHWHACANAFISSGLPSPPPGYLPPWFLAMHTQDRAARCYAYNSIVGRWHSLPLNFCPHPIRPIAPIGSLVLCRPPTASTLLLRLAVCNPFARQYRSLPELNIPRANPAVGVAVQQASFQVYIAGGMSEDGTRGGSTYEPTVEMYDSRTDGWKHLGNMPCELAVRLTVWTQSESVYANGVLYWITSARAYSVMGFEVGTGRWREVKAPEAELLASAGLVRRSGQLTLVGGMVHGGSCCIWELREGFRWELVEVVPTELGRRFLEAGQGGWACTKCVGVDEAIYLYRDLCSAMLVWRETGGKRWEWIWVEGFTTKKETDGITKFSIKGVLLHPSLSRSSFF
ncbi:F-box/kelch-repeat protein At5g15710-like [Aristolochia californica]|uniref:F-box/kelch-repeat protein At5g15710-like n=1 Tax=Aristolochia californica TaxID=171875 RepID=UPI0035DFF19C